MIKFALNGLAFLLSLTTVFAQQQTVGTFTNHSEALDGYTTIFPYNTKTIYLINNCGQEVHRWNTSTKTLIAYLLPKGDLLKAGLDSTASFGNPGAHGILQRYSWDGSLKWQYQLSNDSVILHHDIEMMPNGNILAIAWKHISPEDMRAMGRDSMHPSAHEAVWEEVIYEIKPIGTNDAQIVWEWHVRDHLIQEYDANKANYGIVADHPELLNINYAINGTGNFADWLHFNSLDYNPALDQILLSGLSFNEIYIIDHSVNDPSGHIGGTQGKGGDILYRWGNPAAYNKGTVNDKRFFGQHDPNWILHGNFTGKILVYNNGASRAYSSVEVLDPPMNGNKYSTGLSGTFGPSAPEFIYTKTPANSLYSQTMSGAEILSNGNILITEANKGKITEYDVENEQIVWEYINPINPNKICVQGESIFGNNIFRSYKYPTSYSAFSGKTITPSLPIELEPWPTECNGIDTTTQDTTNQDSTQDSTATVHRLAVDHMFSLYPNPSTGNVYLKSSQKIEFAEITDMQGRSVAKFYADELHNSNGLHLYTLPKGLYLVKVMIHDQSYSSRLILQ